MHKTAYFGPVYVGLPTPQRFMVVFDTGSGHFFLPSTECHDEACIIHRRYNRTRSTSALDVNHDGSNPDSDIPRDQVAISYGTGNILGDFSQEIACIGSKPIEDSQPTAAGLLDESLPPHCARVRLITAKELSTDPFKLFEFDGVIGLGLEALALHPEFHFFNQLSQGTGRGSSIAPIFGVQLSPDDAVPSKLMFGGYDGTVLASPPRWTPVVHPEEGYWRVGIRSVRVGDRELASCADGACSAIVDTGTSLLGVPRQDLRAFLVDTAREIQPAPLDDVDCRDEAAPPLIFDMGDFEVVISADGYFRPRPVEVALSAEEKARVGVSPEESTKRTRLFCQALVLPVDMPALGPKVFIWGEPVLQRYYSTYDALNKQVGFAPVSQLQKRETTPPQPPPSSVVV